MDTPTLRPKLFRVSADYDEYDTFVEAVVYAVDGADAVQIVLDEIANRLDSKAPGHWLPLAADATLTATRIKRERGPVLGHSIPS